MDVWRLGMLRLIAEAGTLVGLLILRRDATAIPGVGRSGLSGTAILAAGLSAASSRRIPDRRRATRRNISAANVGLALLWHATALILFTALLRSRGERKDQYEPDQTGECSHWSLLQGENSSIVVQP
jgi:hypothetical protein